LADAQKLLELIEASLSLSYEILSKEQQQRWRMLAVFPDSFDEAAAAAAWETEDEEARDALGELLAFSLVEWNDVAGRYRLHDLARVFADSRLSEAERDGGRRLHARHYQEVLSVADNLYKNGGDGVPRGLALYDLERVNIEAVHTWAAEQAGGNEAAAWAWPNATVKRTHDSIEFYEQQLQIARETGDRRGEGATLSNLGNAYYSLGETHRAIEFYEQDLAISRETGNRRNEGDALWNMALALDRLEDRVQAITRAEAALVIYEQIESPHAEKVRNQLSEWKAPLTSRIKLICKKIFWWAFLSFV
jgi:tetratricopeptide (TPR) repeat protein